MNEESIFIAALEKASKAQRAAFLDEACAGDLALRRRVEALLDSHERTDFLRTPAADLAASALCREAATEPTDPSLDSDQEQFPLDFLAPSVKPDSLGRLGHYEILEVIGRGGMGVVLRAFDEALRRVVAVKVMAAQLAASAGARRRFAREAQAAAAVSHDHVVTIHAVEEADGLPYLVMQYVAGASLQERLEADGPLQLAEILRIGVQTASGLAAAHAQGLIHRDIKPANILLENSVERVKITDFGLARAIDDASLTQSGVVAGTPNYMAPEQARGEAVDQRADLFSLGSVLYSMCTGRAPFRASGTMAVLKRVCEEAPGPIREANPDVPEWLVAIVEKLHAKDPADRYQSAAEVAEILGRHLAHVQHPPAEAPPTEMPARRPPPRRRRRWAAIVPVLLCLVGGLGLSEATGVTRLAATVIRILTPDGTLVVEANDPGVEVTIEGDGGLVIAGAGPRGVRLRPGSYQVHATKDGKPVRLDRELVTITRNRKQVVRVSVEAGAATAAVNTEHGAFVLLGGKGVVERKFDTLAEAVLGANDGDTIEVRGDGPFVTGPIKITRHAIAIRAGEGFRPVIRLDASVRADERLLQSAARLVLEGLEFQWIDDGEHGDSAPGRCLVQADGVSLHVANCRFRLISAVEHSCDRLLLGAHSTLSRVRNCEFLSPTGVAIGSSFGADKRTHHLDNNVIAGRLALISWWFPSEPRYHVIKIQLMRNTVMAEACTAMIIGSSPAASLDGNVDGGPLVPVQAVGNVFDAGWFLNVGHSLEPEGQLEAERSLKRLIGWSDRDNLYDVETSFFYSSAGVELSEHGPRTLAEWSEFWDERDAAVSEGLIRYEGGDISTKLLSAPDRITTNDFRLRPDSAGYRAGPGGKDLGADIDLVGPGPAYERWKKTPEYQAWLEETRPVK